MYSTKEDKEINHLEVFRFYLGSFQINERFLSPLRVEKNPSFVIFQGKDSKYRFKDFGNGDTGDGIDLIQKKFGLSYEGAKRKISSDLSGVTSFIGLPNPSFIENQKKILLLKLK